MPACVAARMPTTVSINLRQLRSKRNDIGCDSTTEREKREGGRYQCVVILVDKEVQANCNELRHSYVY